MGVTKTLAIGLGGTLLFIVMVGKIERRDSKIRLKQSVDQLGTSPIPPLGVVPQVPATKEFKFTEQDKREIYGRMNYLTTEELIENIEEAEMKGMDDDNATLEDLRWELK